MSNETNICPNCNTENPPGSHICLVCAASLVRNCPNCHSPYTPGSRFCSQCGARLDADEGSASSHSDPASELDLRERMLRDLRVKMPSALANKFVQASRELQGQRREVTILFAEIADFTSLSQNIDSEELYIAIDEVAHLLASIVYKYEGTIDKYTGSGLMALFGIPINHENDPERAVRAALDMQQSMEHLSNQLEARLDHKFQIQIGINTGAVIAGSLGEAQHMEYTVIGNTVQLAAQIQKQAEAGGTLVSFSTYQRSRPIVDYESKPLLVIDEKSEPEKIFRPIGLRLTPGQIRGLPGLKVPMVGRSEQLAKLIEIFQNVVKTQSSQIILCSGEAGIGKSRLVAEFRSYLNGRAARMMQGTCASYMRITPYRVIADVLRNLMGISEHDSIETQRIALSTRLEALGLDRKDVMPYLMHVLGLLFSDPVMEVRIKLLEPSMLLRETHYALRMLFIAETQLSPLVLVFDDLHWVDQASGQFLEYICQSVDEVPLMLIMVARDFGKYSIAQSIRTAASKKSRILHELRLEPLNEIYANMLVDQLVNENTEQAKELKSLITARAGGNPYYTEELVRILVDNGGLVVTSGAWKVKPSAAQIIQHVPGTLRDIILARFDHLSVKLKQVLLKASVLGDSFSTRLLHAIMPEENGDLSEHLINLEERNFLVSTNLGSEEGYLFKHPLLQSTIYNTMLKRDRKNLHTQVAQAIEMGDHWLPGERNQVLAHHLSESAQPEKAIPYLLISAQNAYQHFANETVVQLYEQVLSLMDSAKEVDEIQRLQARVGLAQALKFTSELDQASLILNEIVEQIPQEITHEKRSSPQLFNVQIEALRELADIRAREGALDYAVQLLKQGMELLGDDGRINHPTIWRRLADRLAWVYFRQRNLDEAYNLVDLALLNTPTWEADDPITMASLYNTIGGIYWARSRFADAIESVESSLEIYKNLNYHWGMANTLTNLGILQYMTEKWSRAVEYLEQADNIRREYGDDPERPVNLKNLGEVYIDLGDFEKARAKLQTSLEISLRLGLDVAQVYANIGLCRLTMVEGNFQDASLLLDQIKNSIGQNIENSDREAHYYQLKALYELHHGNYSAAQKSAERGYQIARDGEMPDKQIEALRVLGTIHTKMGQLEQAETFLYRSNELAQQTSDRFSEALVRHEMGLLYQKWSEQDIPQQLLFRKKAGNSLDAAIRIFETLGAKHRLKLAQTARAELPPLSSFEDTSELKFRTELQRSMLRSEFKVPDGEWHQATSCAVIFISRPGTDDELVFETISFLIAQLAQMIEETGGQILRQQDGITAIYGAPVSHEDDPVRAIDTLMQIVNFYNKLNKETELPISIHSGVAQGKIVGGTINLDQSNDLMFAGESIQLARTYAKAAPNGCIWVGESVRNQTSFKFEYDTVSENSLQETYSTPVFQLIGLREQVLPVRGLIGMKSPFIGRAKELKAMREMSQVLDNQKGGIIWIEGEAGIGKSRLMREFSEEITKHGTRILSGTCTARRSEFAFSIFSDLLFQAFEIFPSFKPEQITEQIGIKSQEWSHDLDEIKPFIQLLMGVQPDGDAGVRINSMEPEQLRRQTFVAIHRLIGILASDSPLVLILDDLQWIDSISADLLFYLSHLVVSQRILFVCAQRQKEVSPFQQVLTRICEIHPDQTVQLSINPLTITECRELLHEFLTESALPDSILSLIVQQSGGNPYFIEEFVRLLIEKDFLRLEQGKLVANHTLKADTLVVPPSLESLIRARVDSLDTLGRQLLQVAAVIGRQFSYQLLATVSKNSNIRPFLETLQARGMISISNERDHWEFSHPLIELIVYNTVLRAQRRILHQRTATALENIWRGNEGEHAEELAYHYSKAENHKRALHYMIVAGERAAVRHVNDVALTFFEQAAELLSAVENVSDEARWRIIRGIGEVNQFIGNYEASLTGLQSGLDLIESPQLTSAQRAGIFRRMGDTAHKMGDQEQAIIYLNQALEVLGEPDSQGSLVEAARIYARLGWCLYMLSNLEPAKDAENKSMFYAAQVNNVATMAMAENHLGGISYRQGDIQQAMKHTRTAMDHWEEIGYSWGVAAGVGNLGILESVSGNWDAAFRLVEQSLRMRQEMGDVDGVAITNHNLGAFAREMGDMEKAEEYFRDSLAVSRPFQMNYNAATSYVGLAQSLLYQDKPAEAYEALKSGMRLADEINAPDVILEAKCAAAEIFLARGLLSEAQQHAEEAAELASQIGISPLKATACRLNAASLLRQGNPQKAEKMLEIALDALAESPNKLENGRIHAQAKLVALAQDQKELAEVHHKAASKIFIQLGAARDLKILEKHDLSDTLAEM